MCVCKQNMYSIILSVLRHKSRVFIIIYWFVWDYGRCILTKRLCLLLFVDLSKVNIDRYSYQRNRTTFRYSSLVYGLCTNLYFSCTRVDWWLISNIFLSSLHFCLSFGFVFIRLRSWESWNFRIMCIKRHKFAHRP